MEAALARLVGTPIRVVGSGRTDAGVHALGQVAHLDLELPWQPARLRGALNAALPDEIRVRAARQVPQSFHALHSALAKTYVYQLHLSPELGGERSILRSLPPHRRRSFHAVRADLDLAAMRQAAAALVGSHDFTVLSKAMPAERSTLKTVQAVRLLRLPRGLRLVVTGEGFLYGMVRLMAGLLVEVGRGRRSPEQVPGLLARADRSEQPPSLPAHALHLLRVDYPAESLGEVARAGRRATLRPAILGL